MLVKRPNKDLGTCARDRVHFDVDGNAAVCAVGYGENPVRRLERA